MSCGFSGISNMKIYAFDNQIINNGTNLISVPVTKNGVLFNDAPELPDCIITIFPSSVISLPEGGYRMYYSAHSLKEPLMKIGIAHSDDGYKWSQEKNYTKVNGLPDNAMIIQPNVLVLPGGTWRMYFWLHGGKIRFVCAESSNGIDWKIINLDTPCLYHPNDEEVRACLGEKNGSGIQHLVNYELGESSKAGSKTNPETSKIKKLLSNDATTVYYNSRESIFEMFSVWLLDNPKGGKSYVAHDNAPGILRVIHRRISSDGLNWSDPELVVVPDNNDPDDLQFYYMACEYLENWRIGFLGHYRCYDQTMDVELCMSRDGRKWSRPFRTAWIPRGEEIEADSMAIYSAANLMNKDDESIFYYTGYNCAHNAFLQGKPVHSAIMAATFEKDRFAGLESNREAFIRTEPLIISKTEIIINANIEGTLGAQLSTVSGKAIPGYEYCDSIELKGNSIKHKLAWKGKNLEALQYMGVVLELCVNNGIVYSINI